MSDSKGKTILKIGLASSAAVFATVYLVIMFALISLNIDILLPVFVEGFIAVTVVIAIFVVLYSLPTWLGMLLDRISEKQNSSEKSVDYAITEARLQHLREEGKKMDGQMYYQQKGY